MLEYWKGKLSAVARNAYTEMFRAFSAGQERASCGSASPQDIMAAYLALGRDHPELYILPYDPQVAQSMGFGGVKTEIVIRPTYSRAERRAIDGCLAQIKSALLRSVGSATAEEKEKAVCDLILNDTVYEIDNRMNQNAAAALYAHRAQCSGIARAVTLLLDALGVDSTVIDGETNDGGVRGAHAWNLVWIGGKVYHLDVTLILGANPGKRQPYRYPYFNESDANMRVNHIWDAGSVPACPVAAPLPAGMSAGFPAGRTSGGGASAGATSANRICSLYDFKAQFRSAIEGGKHSYECYADIPVEEGELMKHISAACKFVLNTLHTRLQVSISMRGREVRLEW